MAWWNPTTWGDPIAKWLWNQPGFGGDGFLGIATNTAIAGAINDATTGHYSPVRATTAAFLDPIIPNFIYTPPAGIAPGGGGSFRTNEPGERGFGWWPQGAVPDAWEEPLKNLLLVGGLVAAVVLLRD